MRVSDRCQWGPDRAACRLEYWARSLVTSMIIPAFLPGFCMSTLLAPSPIVLPKGMAWRQ